MHELLVLAELPHELLDAESCRETARFGSVPSRSSMKIDLQPGIEERQFAQARCQLRRT